MLKRAGSPWTGSIRRKEYLVKPYGVRAMSALLTAAFAAGCGGAIPGSPLKSVPFVATASATHHLTVTPVRDGYLRGDASGLRLWGSHAWALNVGAADGTAKITVTSENPAMLAVTPAGGRNRYALQARTAADASSACPKCRVVRAGRVDLRVSVSGTGQASQTYRVPVTIAHKVVAISLNPMPNPSIGGSDSVLQYYDDNASPSVIWDDFDVRNATSFPNVTGLAYGGDGTLYVANSGVAGYSSGTVTEYAPGGTKPAPSKRLRARHCFRLRPSRSTRKATFTLRTTATRR
jgi:hypothetical protein